jgi:hypothetical protein
MSDDKLNIDPQILAVLKSQILEELKDEKRLAAEQAEAERKRQRTEYLKYVESMQTSSEPWVDVTGWSETNQGVKVELEWNDAFVDYLRSNGVTGANDDQIVQHWVTLLLRDMADQMEASTNTDSEYE